MIERGKNMRQKCVSRLEASASKILPEEQSVTNQNL
jgi:hypothetical protein